MENQEYNPTVLYQKLARITQKMQRIGKDGEHPQGYKFATDTDIIESVRAAMAEENVAILASMTGYVVEPAGSTSGNKPIFHSICEFEFTFVCGDTGVAVTQKWFNEALDSSDKGFNKAATAALKYFLMKTFLITTGEPDEHESGDLERTTGSTVQSHQNGSKSSATGSKATPTPKATQNAQFFAVSATVKTTKTGKPFLVLDCGNDTKLSLFSRDMLRNAGYDCEHWTEANQTYVIDPPASVEAERDGQYWQVKSVVQANPEAVPF